MTRMLPMDGKLANDRLSDSCTKDAQFVHLNLVIAKCAKAVFTKPCQALCALFDVKERDAKYRLSGQRKFSGAELAELIRTEEGFQFIAAIMAGAPKKPQWWRICAPTMEAADIRTMVSRNSCIGKAHRLGLGGRKVGRKPGSTSKVGGRTGIGAVVQKINATRKSPFRPGPKVKPTPFVCAPVVNLEPLNISIYELTEISCRYPFGDLPPFTFCGLTNDGGPYCAKHRQICSDGIPTRRGRPHSTREAA